MIDEKKKILNSRLVKKISIFGILANMLLLVIKFIVGVSAKSQAMIADSLHSGEDMLSSIMSYIGAKISSKPCDFEHPYGHGKADYIFSFVISILMIIASATMVTNSIESIISGNVITYSFWLIVVCFVTIFLKLILYIYTKSKLKKNYNILIVASMEDHRNDILVTLGTVISIIFSKYGFTFVDAIFGVILSSWVGIIGIKIFRTSYKVLMDTCLEREKIDEIKEAIKTFKAIKNVDNILSKPVGDKHIIILKMSMDENMSLKNYHDISKKAKNKLIDSFEYIYDVIVHVNPYCI